MVVLPTGTFTMGTPEDEVAVSRTKARCTR